MAADEKLQLEVGQIIGHFLKSVEKGGTDEDIASVVVSTMCYIENPDTKKRHVLVSQCDVVLPYEGSILAAFDEQVYEAVYKSTWKVWEAANYLTNFVGSIRFGLDFIVNTKEKTSNVG